MPATGRSGSDEDARPAWSTRLSSFACFESKATLPSAGSGSHPRAATKRPMPGSSSTEATWAPTTRPRAPCAASEVRVTSPAPVAVAGAPSAQGIWGDVYRLLESKSEQDVADLIDHRVHLLAARRRPALGLDVPPEFVHQQRIAALRVASAPVLLARVRELCEVPCSFSKGPEVAAHYPDPTLRPFKDIDLLVADAETAHRALLRSRLPAGREPSPLRWHPPPAAAGDAPVVPSLEIHSRPKWPSHGDPPTAEDLLGVCRPPASA